MRVRLRRRCPSMSGGKVEFFEMMVEEGLVEILLLQHAGDVADMALV